MSRGARAVLYRASAALVAVALPGMVALRLASDPAPPRDDPMQLAMEDLAIALAASEQLSGPSGGHEGIARRLAADIPAAPGRAWLRSVVAAEAGLPPLAPSPAASLPEGAHAILALYDRGPGRLPAGNLPDGLERLVPYPFLRVLITARAQRLAGQTQAAADMEAVARRAARAMVARTVAISSYFLLMLVCGIAVSASALFTRSAAPAGTTGPPADAIGVFVTWMALHLAGAIPLGALAAGAPGHLGLLWLAVGYVVTGVVALAMAHAWVARPAGLGLAALLGVSPAPGLLLSGALALPAAVPLMLAAFGLSRLLPLPSGPSENPVLAALLQGGTALRLALAVLVALAAPVVEESLFRGLLFPALRQLAGMPLAVAATGLLFGLAHVDLPALLPLWALGSLLSYVRHRTGSVLPCMVAHGLWNLQTFVVVLLLVPPVA